MAAIVGVATVTYRPAIVAGSIRAKVTFDGVLNPLTGTEASARFGWSYANGSDAVAASVAGAAVTLVPSRSVTFQPGDLVEVSTLARREDRIDHGPLFTVATVTPQAGGDLVTLGAASALQTLHLLERSRKRCSRSSVPSTLGTTAAVRWNRS